jgi:hypothetical protein
MLEAIPVDPLERLEETGFHRVGAWRLKDGAISFEPQPDTPATTSNLLYAFVCGRDVLYVGKTVGPLSRRMRGYQKPGPSQFTNLACRDRIAGKLASDATVEVFARHGQEELTVGGFTVNVAAGLEDAIIRELKPTWNTTGK